MSNYNFFSLPEVYLNSIFSMNSNEAQSLFITNDQVFIPNTTLIPTTTVRRGNSIWSVEELDLKLSFDIVSFSAHWS